MLAVFSCSIAGSCFFPAGLTSMCPTHRCGCLTPLAWGHQFTDKRTRLKATDPDVMFRIQ